MTSGYACIKGLQASSAYDAPDRILFPLKRQSDGSFARIPLEQALDEIAETVRSTVALHGGESIGGFHGT